MKDPAFLFYPNDYIGGTLGMTFEQKGAYIELLMTQFNRGHMTYHMIGQVLGQSIYLWDSLSDKFLIDDNNNFYNERLEIEQNKRRSYTDSRKNNKLGINQHTKKDEKEVGHTTSHMTGHMENRNNIDSLLIFDKFRLNYLGSKRGNKTEFENFIKKHSDWKVILPNLETELNRQKSERAILKSENRFIPEWKNLQTWINQRCWEEILITKESSTSKPRKVYELPEK